LAFGATQLTIMLLETTDVVGAVGYEGLYAAINVTNEEKVESPNEFLA